jgi:uncharacterized protein (TIGR02231 family)
MNRMLMLLCLISITMGVHGTTVQSELLSVKVYLQGAEIHRTASVQVPSGIHELVFTGLPADIDPTTVQVQPEGDFRVLSVSHRISYLEPPQVSVRIRMLTDSLEWFRREIDAQQALLKVYQEEESMMLANKSIGGQAGVRVADLRAMADFFRVRISEIKNLQLATQRRIDDLQKNHDRIKNQLAQHNHRQRNPSGEIIVTTSAPRSAGGRINFSYISRNAGWHARYDIRATDTGQPVEMIMMAGINQNTGEDWSNISLTLSTGVPLDRRYLPVLNPWFLYYFEPIPPVPAAEMMKRSALPDQMEPAIYSIAEDSVEMEYGAGVVVTQTTTTHEYAITTPFNIRTGAEKQFAEVQRSALPAVFAWYTIPRMEREVFLVSKISGWEEIVVMPGEAGIFFENAFVGRTFLDPMQTQDTLTVSMGVDRGVSVERVRIADFSRRNITGRRTTETVSWEIRVRNNKNRLINIEIRDQVPVSTQGDLQVTVDERSGAQYDEGTGILTWRTGLQPGEAIVRPFRYSVRFPSDKRVILE